MVILYEDNHLIAVQKPVGISVQEDESREKPLTDYVKEYIKYQYKKEGDVFLGVIHRIDKPVSGLVLFARTSKALVRMNDLFKERKVEKTYLAVVNERPEPLNGTLQHYLMKDTTRNFTRAFDQPSRRSEDAKIALLSYSLMAEIEGQFLLRVSPKTGRPHQIRAQLAKMGWPIVGDVKYGALRGTPDHSICLHSWQLQFEHPTTKKMTTITADPPSSPIWGQFRHFVG